jgi:hypothetical protein
MTRGIFLVANLESQWYCENLIYSIRESGCRLPIRLIHFGGEPVNSKKILAEVEFLTFDNFTQEAKDFIYNLRSVLTDCPIGFLHRFLPWFSDWDEFIYSDNDIVALMNWERLFDFSEDYDLVHADEEYTTIGKFNYILPNKIEEIFGSGSLSTAFTAGHFLININPKMITDINAAVEWFKLNSNIPKKHDQSLLHIATLMGNWKLLNLCKPPFFWLSSWSGDYKNNLDLIQSIQSSEIKKTFSYNSWFSNFSEIDKNEYNRLFILKNEKKYISHLHYSGRGVLGPNAIDDLMFSSQINKERLFRLFKISISSIFYFTHFKNKIKRLKRYLEQ